MTVVKSRNPQNTSRIDAQINYKSYDPNKPILD